MGPEYAPEERQHTGDGPVQVTLGICGGKTRTAPDATGKRFVWQTGDAVGVWAKASDGTYTLSNQKFSLLATGADASAAYFTSTLQSPMAEGTYTYCITYPVPESVSGTAAVFTLPSVQDGKASDGIDITVAEPVQGNELHETEEGGPVAQETLLRATMKHILHFLRFYIPEGRNTLGEPVRTIEFTMPKPVAGTVSVDVTDPSSATLQNGTSTMTLNLSEPIDGTEGDFALAGIFPPGSEYSADDEMKVSVYSESKWSELDPIRLSGRNFEAGHVTGVPLKPAEVRNLYRLTFILSSNNLGEDLTDITLTLPEGVQWPNTSSNVLKLNNADGSPIKAGDSFAFTVKDETAFRAISSKTASVSYESENAVVSGSLTVGDLSSVSSTQCRLDCPYLYFEDFSGVESFSSNDAYGISSAGSKSPHSFLDGWSAARAGAQAGTAIRIACRRETGLANYSARADSPFLSGLKEGKTVNLAVQFDYSMNRQGTPTISQTVHFGWITTDSSLKSGDDTGTFPVEFDVNETTGSYTNIDHTYNASGDVTLSGVQAPLRLSWRTVPETNWGANNNTCWLYIDNIKVKIKNQ